MEYFQSLKKFREEGLPYGLPARLEEDLNRDPQLCGFENEVQRLTQTSGDNDALKDAKRRLANYHRKLKRDGEVYLSGYG
jgi:hypothetical protein